MGSNGGGNSGVEAGFAKLQGEDFEYYMQTYSIMLGRNSKKSTVDLDLSTLGCGMNISRHHARIFYDFQRRRFVLEVIGKNGCFVEGVLHLPGKDLIKLDSQDLIQIGDKEFYFLLPKKSIFSGSVGPRHHVNVNHAAAPSGQRSLALLPPPPTSGGKGKGKKAMAPRRMDYYVEEVDDEDDAGSAAGGSKKVWPGDGSDSGGYGYGSGSSGGKTPASGRFR